MNNDVLTITFGMESTLAIAVALLIMGRMIKSKVNILHRFFIPAPVVGGLLFAIFALITHSYNICSFKFDESLKNLLMVAFFTTVGFTASLRILLTGGVSVILFLIISIVMIIIQNGLGIGLSVALGLDPLVGLAAGSISLTGGHGTSAAFGPLLENAGLVGGTSIAVAAATYGLVAGCLIGGPIAKRLVAKHNLKSDGNKHKEEFSDLDMHVDHHLNEALIFKACSYIIICMGVGLGVNNYLASIDITIPSYLLPMFFAAILRNIADSRHKDLPMHAINVVGSISLVFFLAIALMSMRLWELASLALPLLIILLAQTVILGIFAYFVTFKILGSDYDAAVISAGQCGFALGATPNAIANMTTFTMANGPSPKAFFVVPLVGALFIDFVNSFILTGFISYLG